jgi:hypothetical protein
MGKAWLRRMETKLAVKVLYYEDMLANEQSVIGDVLQFLELDPGLPGAGAEKCCCLGILEGGRRGEHVERGFQCQKYLRGALAYNTGGVALSSSPILCLPSFCPASTGTAHKTLVKITGNNLNSSVTNFDEVVAAIRGSVYEPFLHGDSGAGWESKQTSAFLESLEPLPVI